MLDLDIQNGWDDVMLGKRWIFSRLEDDSPLDYQAYRCNEENLVIKIPSTKPNLALAFSIGMAASEA